MVRLTDRLDMTSDVYRGRKTTTQQQKEPRGNFEKLSTFKMCRIMQVFPGYWNNPTLVAACSSMPGIVCSVLLSKFGQDNPLPSFMD